MDNRQFNVNGSSFGMLESTLKLALEQEGGKKFNAWKVDPRKGFVLSWCYKEGSNKFPVPLDVDSVAKIVWEWLKSDEAKSIEVTGWDEDADHDGDNSVGWRVYCEDWGHVGGDYSAVCAIKRVYLWHGK